MRALLLALFVMILGGPVFASSDNAAIVDQKPSQPGTCIIYFDQHQIEDAGVLISDHVSEVWTKSGNISFICQGMLDPAITVEPGYATYGFTCNLGSPYAASTTETSFRANPAGNWTAKCMFRDFVYPE